jgi:hypothetical protein
MKFGFVDRCIALAVVAFLPVVALASSFEITPPVQAELEKQTKALAVWAADPVVVAAVKEQNAKGPLAGMDNAKWKTIRRSDAIVQGLTGNPAGQFLQKKIDTSGGTLDKAFLNGAQGEKVAFAEKTISYIHKGQDKFEVPMSTGKPWQMTKPWFDESLQAYAIQVAVPVMDGGKAIGVLVASVPVTYLERVAKK